MEGLTLERLILPTNIGTAYIDIHETRTGFTALIELNMIESIGQGKTKKEAIYIALKSYSDSMNI